MDEEYSPIVSNPGYGYGALENDSKRDICKSNCCEDKSQISFWSKLGFALGHVHNDLSACLWFSYCLLFLTEVSQLDQTLAGALIMFGQIVDAVATPILGYLMDRFSTKQKWHLFGKYFVEIGGNRHSSSKNFHRNNSFVFQHRLLYSSPFQCSMRFVRCAASGHHGGNLFTWAL